MRRKEREAGSRFAGGPIAWIASAARRHFTGTPVAAAAAARVNFTGAPVAGIGAAALAAVAVAMATRVLRADAPTGRYTPMGSTVLDTRTGLEWQVSVLATTFDWTDATGYCNALSLNGSGWRLPSITEAATLIDDTRSSPALDPTAFPNPPLGSYWTASPLSAHVGTDAWTISSYDGTILFFTTTQLAHVRCVRSEAPQSTGDGGSDGAEEGSADSSGDAAVDGSTHSPEGAVVSDDGAAGD